MSVDSVKASTSIIQSTQSLTDTSTIVSNSMMGIRIIGLMQVICSILIIIGLIVSIVYIIKSKKTLWKKILIGSIIILLPIIINLGLNLLKFNMLFEKEITKNNTNTNLNSSNITDNKINSDLWLSNYKNLPTQKSKCTLKLFGNENTIGLEPSIDLVKLNELVCNYTYTLYNSKDKIKTSSLKRLNDTAIKTIWADDENSNLFTLYLFGDGLSFRQCIEQGKFFIEISKYFTINGTANISASQIGLNISDDDKNDASKILDALVDHLGGPTYIVATEDLSQIILKNEFDIVYRLTYKYDKYALVFYVEEVKEDDKKTCNITHMYYYPIEFFNDLDITNHAYKYRLK